MLLALIAAVAATPVEAEARQILDEILRVDTSHGNETAALQPLLVRFQRAGVRAQILESALHGADERRPIRWLGEGVRVLVDVTLRLTRSPRCGPDPYPWAA